MRPEAARLPDIVARLVDKPTQGLAAGHVGTVVEAVSPDVFGVEFLDPTGRTCALTELKPDKILLMGH